MIAPRSRYRDVRCDLCARPLNPKQGWRRREGRREVIYCDEHIVINTITNTWRLLERGEVPPEPIGNGRGVVAIVPAADVEVVEPMTPVADVFAGSVPWDDTEPPILNVPHDDDFDPFNDVGF